MIQNGIVVGTDFSAGSNRAVEYAAMLARACGAELTVTHCWNAGSWPALLALGEIQVESVLEAARESTASTLAKVVERLREAGTDARSELREGPASRQLPDVARSRNAGLIVLGRRGTARLAHVHIGSVSERVVRTATTPVLIVPDAEHALRPPRRLLIGIDFSSASAEAVDVGLKINAELECDQPPVLLHAYQDERALWLASASEILMAQPLPHDVGRVRRWLERHGVDRSTFVLRNETGLAETALPDVARRESCDWIVIGLQGRTALASFLMGSTTLRVLERAEGPVLVVPPTHPPERESVG